jgi:hypothetical protein
MGVGYNPRIVTDGLVLCLDAANPRSAPTTAIESAVVSSVTGSGPSYNVVYTTNVSAARVGDKVNVEKREAGAGTSSTVLSTYTYEITGLDRSLNQLTLTYESDTASLGDDSPADLPSGGGSSGSPEIAPHDIVSLWIDMKGGNNGTLTNGPTFSSDNGGSIVFDGSDDYIVSDLDKSQFTTTNEITLSITCKQISGANGGGVLQFGLDLTENTPWILFQRQSSVLRWYVNDGYRMNQSFTIGQINNYTLTYSSNLWSCYKNGIFDTSYSSSIGSHGGEKFFIGTGYNGRCSMNTYSTLIYNRALSAKEVLQNYEATKGRYA